MLFFTYYKTNEINNFLGLHPNQKKNYCDVIIDNDIRILCSSCNCALCSQQRSNTQRNAGSTIEERRCKNFKFLTSSRYMHARRLPQRSCPT